METLTIKIDDSYLNQILGFLQKIPKNKREVFHHQKIDVPNLSTQNKADDFLDILAKGPTLSQDELNTWEQDIKNGYKSWTIEAF
jgi:hypothetical protein